MDVVLTAARLPRTSYDRVYVWGNNAKRATYRGRRCRVVARGALGSVLVEFEDGERTVTSARAVRRAGGR
jgi:hypothetical protein